jgi:hypothetical protein
MKEDYSKRNFWVGIALLIVAIVTVVFVAYPLISTSIKSNQPPKFDFRFGGVLDNDNPRYEVTGELADPNSPIVMSKIHVSATYNGEDYSGQVNIQIKTPGGETIDVANWSNFQKSHSDIELDLTPLDLFKNSGLNDGDPEGKQGWFEIEVTYPHEQLPLHRKNITVVYTPWVHSIQLSDSAIVAGSEDITACVTVKNFGSPSEFKVFGHLYDATSINTSTLVDYSEGIGWWAPSRTWDLKADDIADIVTDMINTNEERTTMLTINRSFFEERHIYILETYAVKNLPYLKYPSDDTWITSDESWRVRDQPHYSAIVVLA